MNGRAPNSSHSTYFYIKINRFVKCFDVGVGELSLDRSADRMLAVSASRFGDSGNLPHLDEPLGALLRRTECRKRGTSEGCLAFIVRRRTRDPRSSHFEMDSPPTRRLSSC